MVQIIRTRLKTVAGKDILRCCCINIALHSIFATSNLIYGYYRITALRSRLTLQ